VEERMYKEPEDYEVEEVQQSDSNENKIKTADAPLTF